MAVNKKTDAEAVKRLREKTKNKSVYSSVPSNTNNSVSRTTNSSAPASAKKSDNEAVRRLREKARKEITTTYSSVKAPTTTKTTQKTGTTASKFSNSTTNKTSDFNTDTKNAYKDAKNGANAKTTIIKSELPKEEREARIKEINAELTKLKQSRSKIKRGQYYGTTMSQALADNETKTKELTEELKSLERVGAVTASEQNQWKVTDARNKVRELQQKKNSFGSRPSGKNIEEYGQVVKDLSKATSELEELEDRQDLYNGISEFGNVVNEDGFIGQWKANYRNTDLQTKASKAMSMYMANPTEENRNIAWAYDAFVKEYMKNNEKALDDKGQVAPLFSKNFASWLAQQKDQFGTAAPFGIVGGTIGLLGGGVPGAKAGWTTGYSVGSGFNSYEIMRGSMFSELLSYGLDEETAYELAHDDAVINALIESGETAKDWIFMLYGGAGGKATNLLGEGAQKVIRGIASKATNKAASKAAKAAAKPLLNLGVDIVKGTALNSASEYLEEFSQATVSRATREKAWGLIDKEIGQYGEGNIDLYNRPQYVNPDGTISTVASMTLNIDGKFVVLPTIVRDKNGRAKSLETEEEVYEQYKKTGEYLGKFDTVEEAEIYANKLHYAQDYKYRDDISVGADDSTLKGAGKVLWDMATFQNPDAWSEAHESGVEGFKTGFVAGGVQGTARFAVNSFFGAKTRAEQNAVADKIAKDDTKLDALVTVAKSTGEGTVANEIAQEIETTRENGEVTGEQVKRLIASTKVYLKEDAKTQNEASGQDTLEQAAREVVESRKKKSGKMTSKTLEALTADNETIYVDEVKQVTGFGDEGAKVVTGLANRNGVTFSQALRTVENAYKAGFTGAKEAQVSFDNKLQETAFRAGKYDRAMQDADKLAQSKNATVYEGAFTENEYTKDYTDDEKKLIASTAKILKMDINAVDKILAKVTKDIYGEDVHHYANAKHEDGYMEIANRRAVNKAVYQMVLHEAFGHRVNQLAPTEFGVVMDALYQRAKAKGRYYDFEYVRDQHNNAELNKNTRDNIEEVAVRELETIFGSAEEVNKWLSEISGNQELKNNWQKFCDWITELIEKIKTAWSQRKMTAEQKAAAQKTVAELDRIKGLLANAVKTAENTATEIANNQAKQGVAENTTTTETENKTDAEGNANFSLEEIVGDDGKSYGIGVVLDSTLLDNLTPEERVTMVKEYVKELGGNTFTAFDGNGKSVDIRIAEAGERFRNRIGKNVPVNGDLTSYLKNNETKQEAITLIDELIISANKTNTEPSRYSHGWLDNGGKNNWDYWTTYIQDKNNTIWEAILNIANSSNGEKILYDIFPINKVGQSVTSDTSTTKDRIPQNPDSVNSDFSLMDKAPTFYSHMGRTIDDMKQEKVGANSVVSYLTGRGVKAEEIKWSGIETFLEGKKSVTKAELQEFVAGSQLQIEENVLSDEEASNYKVDYTDFERKQLNLFEENLIESWGEIDTLWQEMFGEEIDWDIRYNDNATRLVKRELNKRVGDNKDSHYEQIISSLKDVELWESQRDQIVSIAKERTKEVVAPKWGEFKLEGGDNYREILFKMPNSTYSNQAMSTHWGNEKGVLAHARIQDFDVDGGKMLFIEEIQSDWHNEGQKEGYANKLSPAEEKTVADLTEKRTQKYNELVEVLAEIREKDLTDSLYYKATKLRDEERALAEEIEEIRGKDGIPDAPFRNNYHEYVLKRLIRIAAEQDYDSIGWTTADIQSQRWSDRYAEGYRIEYDQDIPKFLNKYGKKWGAKVGQTEIGKVDGGWYEVDGTKVWTMPITDSMKESVLYEGQPQYSLIDDAINQSMTMEQAKDMIQRAFVLGGIEEWFEGEYKNGDEWLKGQGADEVALIVENEYILQQKFLDKVPGVLNGDFYAADIIEAYAKGTLTGKVKQNPVKRLDTSKTTNATDTRVFAPKDIKNAQEIYKVASERVTNSNRDKVYQARADIIMFAHNRGAAEALGLTQSELNKKLATWARYTARAKEVSMRINKDASLFNRWTGIENSNILNRATVSQAELDNLVNDVQGDSNGWQRNYIMRTMLALDTHIDYSELNFEFVGTPKTTAGKSVNGLYDNSKRKITVKYNAPHTVSHEMGHFIDYQWARDFGLTNSALTDGFGRDRQTDADVKQFLTNFDEFIEQIENSADLRSEYTMGRKEVFARFVAKFVQWVDLVANGSRSYQQEYLSYNDKFTTAQYVEFVRLLQEKSMLDSKKFENTSFSLIDTDVPTSKDTKALLETIEKLKHEFELTKFAKADQKKLAKMTKSLLKEYSSQSDYDETFKAIDELYQYLANGEDGHPAVWADAYSRAYGIAERIVDNALVLDDEQYREYKGLRDYLRNTPMKLDTRYDSVPSGYENFQDFRRKNWGRLNFTKDGLGVDSVYQELTELYPELFSDKKSTIEDMLEQIVEVLDSIQPTEVNPFSYEMKAASSYLANDIMDRFFDIPQAKPTFADKAERRVVEARIKGGKKVEAVREQTKKRVAAERKKAKRQLDKLRQQRDARVKKEQAKRREAISKMSESQKAKVLRAQITRHVGDLSRKLVNPTDNQHIPEDLKGAVAKLLESINLESNYTYNPESRSYKRNDEGLPTKRTKAFEELRNLYGKISSTVVVDPDLLGDDGLLHDVIELADKRIADMNSTELQTVWDAVRAIEASVNTANKIFSQGKFETILEYAEALREDNSGKKERAELRGVFGKGNKLAALDMLTPETYFHYLGGAGDSIFRMMRDAQDKHISIMKEVAYFTRKTLKDVDVNSLEKTIHTVTLDGEDVKLSTAQLMELYVLMKREQAIEHILKGGILPDVTKGKGLKLNTKAEPIRNVSMAEITEALSNLTEEQKKIADKLQKYVSTVLSEYGNEASMKVYNYEKFNEKNYWTIRTNKQEIQSDVGKDTAVTTVANKGMAKGTKPHANTSVRIGSIFDTFATHSSDMATYAAWLGTSEDVNRIRNFVFWNDNARVGTVKGILDTVHGIHGSEYLENLLKDIAIGVKGNDNMNPFDKLIGNYKAAAVAANARVIIQQPTAILRATDMIGAHYLAEGAYRPLKGWEKAKKYAPIAQWKDWGHFDINTGRQMKDVLFDNANVLEKTKQVGMWGASMADSLAWGQLWNAVELETKAKRKDLEAGTDEFYEAVAKRFTEIVDHTQVVDGILQRSQIMRNPDTLSKMATSFMGEPTKQYNMAVSALYDAKNGKGDARKKAVARLGRTAMSLAVSGIANAAAQSIIDALRDDDKEKDYWEKWLTAFIGDGEETKWYKSNLADTFNPLTYVPFVKDILSIMQGYDVKRMDAESITKTYNAITNMYKAVTGTVKYTVAEASAQLFAEVARLYGLPVANVKRDIKAAVTTYAIETENYLMQYRIEKAMLNINFESNRKNFIDILYNAYNNDMKAYNLIYNDLIKSGVDAEKIKSGMETRMKKAEGVEKATELKKRYMTPETEKKYDSSLKRVKSSQTWRKASASERKEAEGYLYDFLTSTSEDMQATRTEARKAGIDETEYTLWQLAKEMANKDGKDGLTTKERANAIKMLDLGSSTEWDLYLFNNESKGAEYAREKGVTADTYADFIESLYKVDKPTKTGEYGTFTQDEARKAVKSLKGLSQKEKAALWQSVNTKWKNNPF